MSTLLKIRITTRCSEIESHDAVWAGWSFGFANRFICLVKYSVVRSTELYVMPEQFNPFCGLLC